MWINNNKTLLFMIKAFSLQEVEEDDFFIQDSLIVFGEYLWWLNEGERSSK